MTSKMSPTAESTAPRMSKGRVGSAGSGSSSRRLSKTITAMIKRLKHEGRPPADRRGDQATDQRPGRGAHAPHRADHAERASARRDPGEQQRREDVDRRDQQRGAHALQNRIADDEDTQARSDSAEQSADAVHDQTEPEQPHPAVAIGQLAAGDHQRRHDQQEDRYRDLHTLDGGVQILADVVDHHVHVRAGEAADELREG